MRYNSLRSQLNWHSKQQNHLFKKLNKPPTEKQPAQEEVPPPVEPPRGHELMWLEKMMKELQQYKEQGKEGTVKQQRQVQSVDAILKEKCGNASRGGRMVADRPQKVAVGVQENGKSSKKIKFEIVMHSDKPPSAKKIITSEPKNKPKSIKKTPTKQTTKKSLPEKQSANREVSTSMLEAAVCCPSNTKVIEMDVIKTDPYSFKETDIKILEHLWKRESENSEKEGDKMSLTSKKSVGKIIRNSDKLNKTCLEAQEQRSMSMASRESAILSKQDSAYKQYKQSRNKQSISINSFQSRDLQPYNSKDLKNPDQPQPINIIQKSPKDKEPTSKQVIKPAAQKIKAKYEKIFIKLETQKLSEYLCEKSERAEDDKQKTIETNQYQKYCQTNRVEASTTSESINIPAQTEYKSLTAQKIFKQAEIPKKDEPGPRAKSQQRKFNKCAQVIKKNNYFEPDQKDSTKKEAPSSSQTLNESKAVIAENRVEVKLKRKYDYTDDINAPPPKAQKLFTLHSVSSEHSENQLKEDPVLLISIPQHPTQEQQPSINIQVCSPLKQSRQNESRIISQQPSAETIEEQVQQSFYLYEQPSKDPTQQLTLLFNFLDEGHRGLLTDTNCQYQSLTQDLKLLFSAILNQIRTKKRFYNLQRFIEQSKKVLQVKNEVYMHNHCKSPQQKDMVYLSLRQNVDILRKKYPIMFVKCTFTQSCSDTSHINSKKSSFNYGQSLVIDRVQIERKVTQGDQNEGVFKNCLQEKGLAEGNVVQISNKNAVSAMDSKWTRRDKENAEVVEQTLRKFSKKIEDNGELDILQPEIYLEKKYGLIKCQQETHGSDKMSSILQKTRGYLDNLDNYLKIR